jgi:FkbH-like protein
MEAATVRAPGGPVARPLAAAEYARLARELSAAGAVASRRPLRTALLSSCSMQFVEPALVVEAARRGLHLTPYFGPFGQFEPQIVDEQSSLHSFAADVLILVMRPEDLDPDFVARYYSGSRSADVLQATIERLVNCVAAYRAHSAKPILVANFATPARLPLGPFDANAAESLTYALMEANRTLRARLAEFPDAIVWDYAGLVRESGADAWSDARLWALARLPVAADKQPLLARHLTRALAALVFPPAKCLVLDLDNTLWGGVIGDDGIEGIQLGDDYPGNAFKAFQRAILGLTDRGILLAVVSKNYQEVVEQALREHPEMLIRPEHLSAMRVNWQPKSQNLREIAAELNIGLDALVHFDDNPAERAEIAANAPEVRVVDVPANPVDYERALYDCGFFDAVTISDEDRQRVVMYRTAQAREQVRATTQSVHEYLNSLEMVAETGLVDTVNLGRVAQLIGKTNQFNLTTRRHSQAEISGMCNDGKHSVHYLRLSDRFGDLGLIAVGVVSYQDDEGVIDTFVMSCRAMGRQAEIALMQELIAAARARGCRRLIGEYLPTAKNGIVAELYPTLGFSRLASLNGSGDRFGLDLADVSPQWPAAIRRSIPLTEAL